MYLDCSQFATLNTCIDKRVQKQVNQLDQDTIDYIEASIANEYTYDTDVYEHFGEWIDHRHYNNIRG